MGFSQFPFLSPLNEETVKKIKSRESNKESLNTLMPFVILSSAAVATNTIDKKDIPGIYASENFDSFAYKGCVVANTTDILKRYQTGETIAGYDLDGKPIKVEGEVNRRVSVPMIESVEIDTSGGNNTLKEARVKIRVFTLKQLEMFELFFLRPGMNVVLEYGWNSMVRKNYDLESKMFATKNHKQYVQKYTECFSNAPDGYKKAKIDYLKLLVDTDGDYDFMAGKVTNYTYSIQTDGTYDIDLTISAGNELTTWAPVKQEKKSDVDSAKGKKELPHGFDSWIIQLTKDLHKEPEFAKNFGIKKDWETDFFNWDAVNLAQKDTSISKTPYISFKLILHILNKIKNFNIIEDAISYKTFYEDEAGTKPIIPISSTSNIISPTEDFILPGDLPSILVSKDEKKKNVIVLNPLVKEDCKIHGKKFNLTGDAKAEKYTIYNAKPEPLTISSTVGNLLNLYFNYNKFIEIYNQSYTQADIVNAILEIINQNMFGLVKLVLQKESDAPTSSPLIIMDAKMKIPNPNLEPQKIFRFNIGATNSIVKEFNFSTELSELMQAQALYATQLAIAAARQGKKDDTSVDLQDEKEPANLDFAKNSNGYFSINATEIRMVKEAEKWNPPSKEESGTTASKPDPKKEAEAKAAAAKAKQKESEEEIKNLSEVRNSNYVKFKLDLTNAKEVPKNFIYKDPSIIQKEITKEPVNTTTLTHIVINLAIDGIAGLRCGEFFHIDGIPEIYNKNGYFQIQNVKQGISSAGWQTTIEAGFRLNHDE